MAISNLACAACDTSRRSSLTGEPVVSGEPAGSAGHRYTAIANCSTAEPVHVEVAAQCSVQRLARICSVILSITMSALLLTGCSSEPAKPASQTETKPAEPPVPDDVKSAAESLLGASAQVLVFGDLAKNGKQQFLAANVVPKTPQNNIPGLVVTRAVIAENNDGWHEIFRADEHLKNLKGFLALTPLQSVTGWRLQYEQNPEKGLQLYFTPVKGVSDSHVLPIGVRWNPEAKRYQSMDRSYEHFLNEAPQLENARSSLR
jgi:hypothetical protein